MSEHQGLAGVGRVRLVKKFHNRILAAGRRVWAAPGGRRALFFGAGVSDAPDFEQVSWNSIDSTDNY